MICYLPFTYISERHLALLCQQLGPLTMYIPDETLVPDHMRAAAGEGDIDLRPLQTLAPGRLIAAIQAFKQWAHLHQGNLADVAGFFKAANGRFPMMDETNPSQIRTQIRRFEDSPAGEDVDPLFQAALFLAMAQEYDQQQESMRQGLGSVQTLEREMLGRLAGVSGADSGAGLDTTTSPPPADLETGGYMTAARLEAWAQLALQDADPPLVYLTDSPAVIDHLLNLFPEAEKAVHLEISTHAAGCHPSVRQRRDALKCLCDATTPQPNLPEGFESISEEESAGLTLYLLNAIAPRIMLQRLSPSKSADDTAVDVGKTQALIGLVTLP